MSALALPIDVTPPKAATNLASTYASDRIVNLTWTAAQEDVQNGQYTVIRDGQAIGVAGGTSFVDRTTVSGTTYQYQVRSADAMGNTGGTTGVVSVTTPAAPPSGTGTGLAGAYFADADLTTQVATRLDPRIDFAWGTGALIAGVTGRPAAVRWTGQLLPRYSETYTVTVAANSNARLWLGGYLVVDGWGWVTDDQERTWTANIACTAGVPVPLRLEYLDRNGSATAHLSWESWSEPRAIIPTAQLLPAVLPDPNGNVVLGDGQSRTSPAWVEGQAGSADAVVTAAAGSDVLPVIRPGGTEWFLSNAVGSTAPGVVLTPGTPTTVQISAARGDSAPVAQSRTLTWVATSLDGAKATTVLSVRVGDSLLFSSAAGQLAVDPAFAGTFTAGATGVGSAPVPVLFPSAGTFTVVGQVAGAEVGRVTVRAVSVALPTAVADMVGFRRATSAGISPIAAASAVVFTVSDPNRGELAVTGTTATGQTLTFRSSTLGDQALLARLGSATGPVLASVPISTFEISTTAKSGMRYIQTFPDGSLLSEATLTMNPWVAGLTVNMNTFVSGCTFDDSTTQRTVLSAQFAQQADGRGAYLYRLLLAPTGWYHSCHAIHVSQDGVAVSP